MKELIKQTPILGPLLQRLYRTLKPLKPFDSTEQYWIERYQTGGNSGPGSYSLLAQFKAEVLNAFVAQNGVNSVIEFGSGDGNQLLLATYPNYTGFDISPNAIQRCKEQFAADKTKQFKLVSEYAGETAQLTMSLDVIYHLVEDSLYEKYMKQLFASSEKYVIVYSSDFDGPQENHVRHRRFTEWVKRHQPGWELQQHIPNRYPYKGNSNRGSLADFYIYARA